MFAQAVPVGLLFFGLLALNGVEKRFWCKYLCPLGALLKLFPRYAIFSRKVSEGCNDCGACVRGYQSASAPEARDGWRKAECLLCGGRAPSSRDALF